ncbi:STAS domain-containing protein [Jidongwangia harbinensis]|uniref:STAS domain-containing protein n=1 Tax=Jidongwangia harbinensis TaxID=2878561 RepID=UPI001CD95729|nr:STAS domain-containing protein [Jidongwangia harbinensis]MCA2219020.1 STAS domain-containing protein [Jidongwangia harbinensis]
MRPLTAHGPQQTSPELVVVVSHPLDDDMVERWQTTLAEALAAQPKRLIIDLSACPRMDAAAIVLLLRAHRQMVCADGTLVLRRPKPRVRRLLSLGRIDQVLEVDPDDPETT